MYIQLTICPFYDNFLKFFLRPWANKFFFRGVTFKIHIRARFLKKVPRVKTLKFLMNKPNPLNYSICSNFKDTASALFISKHFFIISLLKLPLSIWTVTLWETPMTVSLETQFCYQRPQIFIGDPKFFWRPYIFLWRPQNFHWRPQIFVEDSSFSRKTQDFHRRLLNFHWRLLSFRRRPQYFHIFSHFSF